MTGDPVAVAATEVAATVLKVPGVLWAAIDAGGVVRRVGPGVGPVLGMAPGAVAGRRALLFVDRADLPVAAAAAARVMAGDEVTGVVLRIRHGDGGWRRVRFGARIGPDGMAQVLGRDVTVQRDAVERAADREALARAVLDHMPMPAWVTDRHGRYRFVNRELCRLAGLATPEDAVGRSADGVWPASGAATRADEWAVGPGRASGGPGEGTVEEAMVTADGPRTFLTARRLVADGAGGPQASTGIATDITDRAAAASALAERTRLLDAILAASPDAIALVDRRGAMVRHNLAVAGIVGERRPGSRLADMLSLVHPDDVDAVTAAFAELLAGATAQAVIRYRLRHHDGHWVTVDSRAQVERDGDGRVAGMVVVTRDVSEDLVAETRLRSAVAAAEATSQAKSELLSRMSHDLRTPLDSILGFAQLLQTEELPPDRAADVDALLVAGRRLLARIDEVLDLARIETGHLVLERTTVALGPVLAAAAGPGESPLAATRVEDEVVELRLLAVTTDAAVADLLVQLRERRPGVAVHVAADDDPVTGRAAVSGDVDVVLLDGPDAARSPTLQALRESTGRRPLVALVVAANATATARRLLGTDADAVLAAPLDGRAVLDLIDAAARTAHRRQR